MKVLKIILILLLFIISCQNANKKEENHLVTFDLKELPKITTVKLSDFGFVDIEYIPLETDELSLISKILDLKVSNNFFLIQDYTKILEFKTDGSFVAKIGTKGRGPNEYQFAHDIDIDGKNQIIYIVSRWGRKFYKYDERGQFIRTFECPLNTTNFKITEGKLLCFNNNIHGDVENSYILIDTSGRIIKNFPNRYPFKPNNSKNTFFGFDENLFYRFNNLLLKKEIYSDTVYSFENMDFKPHLVFEHGKRLLTSQSRTDFINYPDFFKYFLIQKKLFEFGDYIYYEFIIDRSGRPEGLSFIGSKKSNFRVLVDPEKDIINDLDGGLNIWPRTVKDDNTILDWVDAIKLKKHVASDAFKKSTPKYPEKKTELEKLANSLKETDNPVLVLVKLNER